MKYRSRLPSGTHREAFAALLSSSASFSDGPSFSAEEGRTRCTSIHPEVPGVGDGTAHLTEDSLPVALQLLLSVPSRLAAIAQGTAQFLVAVTAAVAEGDVSLSTGLFGYGIRRRGALFDLHRFILSAV